MKRSHALVLTSPPARPSLSDFVVTRAWDMIAFGERLDSEWLSAGEAWQARFVSDASPAELTALRARIATAFNGITLDVNIVPGEIGRRRKKLLVADMDSTIIQQECIDEMADVFGIKPRIARITERAMRGELPFEAALKERLGLLAGLTGAQLQSVYDTRIRLMPGAGTLIATMHAAGATTALVSGGFTFFTDRVAKAVGFDENHANVLEFSDGKLTGSVVGPILGREAKKATLERLTHDGGLDPQATLAVGDGANDLDMIRSAGLGVAYRAKPIVAAEAAASISHGDLTALLYLQGYRRAEFVG
jgi:phosphoserine phosphatase